VLKKIGFKSKKCKNRRSFLMERNDTVAQRATYLRRMKKNDEQVQTRNVLCIWMKHGFTRHIQFIKCWQDSKTEGIMKNDSAGQWWIIVHAGSERGFVPGAYLIFKSKTKRGTTTMKSTLTIFRSGLGKYYFPIFH
jgi:hypothetical protein